MEMDNTKSDTSSGIIVIVVVWCCSFKIRTILHLQQENVVIFNLSCLGPQR